MSLILSMTGFGKASHREAAGLEATAELRAFNSKNLKLSLHLPSAFYAYEEKIRSALRKKVHRGSVNLTISFHSDADSPDVQVRSDVLGSYADQISALAKERGQDYTPDFNLLATLPEAVEIVDDTRDATPAEFDCVMFALTGAIDALIASRAREGEALETDLRARIDAIRGHVEQIETRAPQVVEEYRQRLETRLKTVLAGQENLCAENFRAEVALFAERADIHEECVRARHHADAFLEILDQGGEVGRRLDFIAQELHREVNTINSKASDFTISEKAVAAKSEIDKIKEQVQNVE